LSPGRRSGLIALALLAWASLFLHGAVFGGRVLYRRDINMVWLPQAEAFVRCLAAGSLPLWDPWAGFGRPLLADPRAEVLYPPTWLNLILLPGTFYTVFCLGHLAFSGAGMFVWARRMQVSRPGALLAAAIWIGSGPFLSLVSMWHHLAGAAWLPWLFVAADRALDGGARDTLVWGAVLAAQFIAGSPDLTLLACPALAAYVLFRRPRWKAPGSPPDGSRLGRLAIAGAFALGLACPLWLPTLERALGSARPGLAYGLRTTWSLHPATLGEIVLPLRWADLPLTPELQSQILESREPWLHSLYLGIPAALFVLAGLLSRRPRARFLGLLLGVAVLFALGRNGVGYDLVSWVLPPLRMLRFPVKAMLLAALAWSPLAGLGFDASRDPEFGRSGRFRLGVVLPAGVLLVSTLAGLTLATRGAQRFGPLLVGIGNERAAELLAPTAPPLAAAALAAGLGLLIAANAARGRGGRLGSLLLWGLALVDLGWVNVSLHRTAPAALFTQRPEALAVVKQVPLPRLYVYDYSILTATQLATNPGSLDAYRVARRPSGWSVDEALVLGIHSYLNPPTAERWGISGSYDRDILEFDPLPLARLVEFLRRVEASPTHARLLRMAGVTHALALTPAGWWKDLVPRARVEGLFERPIQILEVPQPLPRAFAVDGVRVADGDAAFETLADPRFDPATEVVLSAGRPAAADPRFVGRCRIIAMKPDRVVIDADLSSAGYVVLTDAWDPGWRARLDGGRVPTLRANVAFRAVAVPAGRHSVEFSYRPMSAGVGVAAAALALALGGSWLRAPRT